ncbi:unnamed protein product [Merluccius merluccius]
MRAHQARARVQPEVSRSGTGSQPEGNRSRVITVELIHWLIVHQSWRKVLWVSEAHRFPLAAGREYCTQT